MNFKKMLSRSGDGLLQARANNIANTVKTEQEQVISEYKRTALSLMNQLTNLMDLSINNTTSLSPVDRDFNPREFCEKIHALKSTLRDALIDWKIALETYNVWFPEDRLSMSKELENVCDLEFDVLEAEEESDVEQYK